MQEADPIQSEKIIYTCKSKRDGVFYGSLVLTAIILLGCGILLAIFLGWIVFIAATVIPLVLMFGLLILLLPKRYEVWPKSIKVVFFSGLKWNISIYSVTSVEHDPGYCAIVGYKFSTSGAARVLINRRDGLAVYISPEYPKDFCQHVRYALSPGSYGLPTVAYR